MNAARRTDARWVAVGVAVPALAIVATWVVAASLHPRLPEPLATHWGTGSAPDGSMSFAANQWLLTGLALASVAIGTAVCLRVRSHWAAVRATASFTLAMALFFCGVDLLVLAANVDAASWHDVSRHWWWVPAIVLVLPAAFGAGWLVLRPTPDQPAAAPRARAAGPSLGLGPSEQAVWMGHLSSRPMVVIGAGTLALMVLIAAATGGWWLLVVGVAAALLLLATAAIRVTVDARGLTVTSTIIPLRWKHVPLERMTGAWAIDVRPTEWGGWGYRLRPASSAVVLRGGPGLRVDLTDGRAFVVTVDDPTTAAGLLNDLRARGAR